MAGWKHSLSPGAVRRVATLSYTQGMVGAIYAASTGGMFLIGYALKLHASNFQIGLMSTLPMLCVFMQLAAAMLIEGGASRRKLTIAGTFLNVGCWAIVITIPYVVPGDWPVVRLGALIATISLITVFGHMAGNARGSWVGDLVPESIRGTFFGRMTMYGSIVGTVFAVIEGAFLDFIKGQGIEAFGILFGFGMIFGFINGSLFLPQPDMPTHKHKDRPSLDELVRTTLSNRPLRSMMIYATFWLMQMVAWPFYNTYMLRELHMPFVGVGLVAACQIVFILASAPFWGRVVNRYGCRPVLTICTAVIVPLAFFWMPMTSATQVYWTICPMHILCGFVVGGISVGMNTLLYKVTTPRGRSMQLAVYAIIVTVVAAPMPSIGGLLPEWTKAAFAAARAWDVSNSWLGAPIAGLLQRIMMGLAGVPMFQDVRLTFAASMIFACLAVWASLRIIEPGALPWRVLLRNLPGHLLRPRSLRQNQGASAGKLVPEPAPADAAQ